MRIHLLDSRKAVLDSALRSLDAADGELNSAQQRQAANVLERILATPSPDHALRFSGVTLRRRSRRLLPVSAAVAAAGLVALAVDLPGDGGAYASWNPEPATLTAAELNRVAPVCREGLSGSGSLDLERAQLVLSERRGDTVALLYRTDDPDMAGSCLMRNISGTDEVADLSWGVFGGSGAARTAPPRGFIPGGASTGRDVTVTEGAVGADVVAVTVHAPGNLTAQATVKNGRYVVWWPGPDYDVTNEGTAEARSILTYDLTLTDGTTIHNAPPTR